MKSTVARASSWNPAAKFIILFNNVEHRARLGRLDVMEAFQEIAIQFHVNHICLLFAVNGRMYDIYVSKLFQKSPDGECGTYLEYSVAADVTRILFIHPEN